MPTTKKRINICVSEEMDEALERLAKRDEEPVATKAAGLLKTALEIEEDRYFEALARERDTKQTRWVSHKNAWR